MKCLSLFSSVTVATCLGLNALVPASAQDYRANDWNYREPTNQLRGNSPSTWNSAAHAEERPWYEKLPPLGVAPSTPVSAREVNIAPHFANDEYYSRGNETPSYDRGSQSTHSPYTYARQQRTPVVGEVETLPPSESAFNRILDSPRSVPPAPNPELNTHSGSGEKDYWSTGVGKDYAKSFGIGNRLRHGIGHGGAGCGPLWQAGIDFYYLRRTQASPVTVLVDDTTRSIEEFNGQSLDFGDNLGYGVRLSRNVGCGAWLDFGYFGVYDQSDAIELTGDLALVLPGFATGGNPAAYNMDYDSQLSSFEMNLRQDLCGRFGVLAGLRYINLQEDLLISSQLGAVVTLDHLDIDTNNHLFGAQLGTNVCLWSCRSLRFDAIVKCGFYLNDASVTTRSSLIGQPLTASSNPFAVAGEAGLYGTYCINDCWSIRAGYQVLGFHGIALAPEQLGVANLATDTTGINTAGSAVYGGGTVGVQYTW